MTIATTTFHRVDRSEQRELERQFVSQTDECDATSWYSYLDRFADASLYQTWHWGAQFSGPRNVSHLVLRRSGDVVAIAQARLSRLPRLPGGIAFVRWGPVWQRKGEPPDPEVFRQVVRALRNEYVTRRRMALRLVPRAFTDTGIQNILYQEGFVRSAQADRSLVINLTPSIEDLRALLAKKWRNQLSKAERQGLSIRIEESDCAFEQFMDVYGSMLTRKSLVPTSDLKGHRRLQGTLPSRFKMQVVTCSMSTGTGTGNQVCAGGVFGLIGDTAVYLFGATNEAGMRTSASYLVQWEMIKLLKSRGFSGYDLHGVDPESNPGTYHFKKGLAENSGKDVHFVGRYDAYPGVLVKLVLPVLENVFAMAQRISHGLPQRPTRGADGRSTNSLDSLQYC